MLHAVLIYRSAPRPRASVGLGVGSLSFSGRVGEDKVNGGGAQDKGRGQGRLWRDSVQTAQSHVARCVSGRSEPGTVKSPRPRPASPSARPQHPRSASLLPITVVVVLRLRSRSPTTDNIIALLRVPRRRSLGVGFQLFCPLRRRLLALRLNVRLHLRSLHRSRGVFLGRNGGVGRSRLLLVVVVVPGEIVFFCGGCMSA